MSATETKPRRTGCWILLLLGIGVLVVFGWLGLKGWRTFEAVRSLQARQADVELLLENGITNVDPEAVELLLNGVRQDVATIRAETALFMPLTPYLGWVPRFGPLIEDAPAWLEMADAGTLASVQLYSALKPALGLLQAGGGDVGSVMSILADAQPAFAASDADLERITEAYAEIDSWDALPSSLRALQEPVDGVMPLAGDAMDLLALTPDLMGMNGPRTYLLLAQNDDELRATGGLISGIGLARVVDGEIESLEFIDSYDVDDLENKPYDLAPEPMARFMGIYLLLMRDANYWPDFPYSAEQVAYLFEYGMGDVPPIDGVIAIDQEFLRSLLEVTGPVNVPELDLRVDSRNVIDQLRTTYNTGSEESADGAWWQERKSFMAPVATAIQARLFEDLGRLDVRTLLFNTLEAGRQKHLQLYLTDSAEAAVVNRLGLDGALPIPDAGDLLLVQDMNMGYNKVNAVIDRQFRYTVDLSDPAAPAAHLEVDYTHNGNGTRPTCIHFTGYTEENQYQGFIDNCYWNYLRIYTPPGSSLVDASRHPVSAEWLVTGEAWDGAASTIEDPSGLAVFDNFMVVEQNSGLTSEYRYALPPDTVQQTADGASRYTLTLVKPAGALPERIQVRVILPPGAADVVVTPGDAQRDGDALLFDLLLDRDLDLAVEWR